MWKERRWNGCKGNKRGLGRKLEQKIWKGKRNDSASDEIANTTFLKNRNLYS